MSVELLSNEQQHRRRLSDSERALLQRLLADAGDSGLRAPQLSEIEVTPMPDGGMGSLLLWPPGAESHRRFGRRAAEVQYQDIDGVPIIASLNLDQYGLLFELDVWKVDFSEVQRLSPP